jgi:hypothetical protein
VIVSRIKFGAERGKNLMAHKHTHRSPEGNTHRTPEGKKDRTSDRVAVLALVLSILSSGFAVYQWWSSAKEERIRAAIEISNKFNDDAVNPAWIASQVTMGYGVATEQFTKVGNYFYRLEYVAYLANHDLVDKRYLSESVLCAIVSAKELQDSLLSGSDKDFMFGEIASWLHAIPMKETTKFGAAKDWCPETPAKQVAADPAPPSDKPEPPVPESPAPK